MFCSESVATNRFVAPMSSPNFCQLSLLIHWRTSLCWQQWWAPMEQRTVNPRIWRFGGCTHSPAGNSKRSILAESDFNLFVLCRLPDAESHPLALLRPGFLHNLVFKVFPGRACPPSWRKTARQRRCCKFHLMQQGHPTGWVKLAATAILGEAQMWIIRNEALRGLSASSLHPGTFRSSRPSTSHCEAGRGHFPGMSRSNLTNGGTLLIVVAPAMMFGDTAYCKYSCWHLTGAATGAKDVFCKLRTRTEMRSTQAHCMGPYDKRTPKTSSSWGQLNRKMLALPCCSRTPSLSSYCEACEACEERQGLWPIIGSKVVKGGKTSNRWASVSISHWIQFSYADHCVSYVGPSLWQVNQVNKHASQRHEYIQMAMRIIARVTCKSSGTGNGDESVNPAVCLRRLSSCLAGIPYQPGLADHWLVVSIAAWMRKDFCQGTCTSMISRAHGKKKTLSWATLHLW